MKNMYLPLLGMVLLFSFSSCVLEEEIDTNEIDVETISARWVVSGSSQPFESFEFFDDNQYMVVMNQPLKSSAQAVQLFGTYEIISSQKIRLSDFGTITFRMVNSKDAVLDVKLDDDSEVSMEVYKAERISGTDKTKLLCRVWKREPYESSSFLKDYELKILFSHSGTYFISLKDPDDNRFGTLNFWKWKDAEETTICYSPNTPVDCNGEYEMEIVELKTNLLKVKHPDGLVESYYPTPSLR
jgi:hypothetical protein